jgi:type II secretion system protein H
MKSFHDRQGFTLIELMVVVAIIGVCAAIAMPAMTSYKRKEDTRRAAVNVSGMLTNARSQAIASGRMTFLLLPTRRQRRSRRRSRPRDRWRRRQHRHRGPTAADLPERESERLAMRRCSTPHDPGDRRGPEADGAASVAADGPRFPTRRSSAFRRLLRPGAAAVAADTGRRNHVTDNDDTVLACSSARSAP